MSSHYIPYSEHYKIKKLVHKSKLPAVTRDNSSLPVQNKPREGKTALLIVDVQNDFLPGGSTPIKGDTEAELMINSINELLLANVFDYHIFTQDVHPSDHVALASAHQGRSPFDVVTLDDQTGKKYEQVLWVDHCIAKIQQDSTHHDGVQLSDKLVLPFDRKRWRELLGATKPEYPVVSCEAVQITTPENADENATKMAAIAKKTFIFWKGFNKNADSYSAFKDALGYETGLRRFLTDKGIKEIYVCGLARDFCVWWSCVDGTTYEYTDVDGSIQKEFKVNCILDATLPVPGSIKLPDYDQNGDAPHHKIVNKLSPESVHGDLTKNNIDGNSWVKAFLDPYGVRAVSWVNVIDELTERNAQTKASDAAKPQSGGSIFRKKVQKNTTRMNTNVLEGVDVQFLRGIK